MDGPAFGIHKYPSIFIAMNPFALFNGDIKYLSSYMENLPSF